MIATTQAGRRRPLPLRVVQGQTRSTPEGTRVSARVTTPERILEVSRLLFNRKGYANTTIADIAAEAGIAVGNLSYHFPAKRDLAAALEKQLRELTRAIRTANSDGEPVADKYVEAVLSSMTLKWEYRFVLRDYLQFSKNRTPLQRDPDLAADFYAFRKLLGRIKREGLFRRDRSVDLDVLTRSLFLIGRYWTEHLQEHEGLSDIEWSDLQRGFEHHFAMLFPNVTAAAQRSLEAALLRVSSELATRTKT